METSERTMITVEATIMLPVEKVWNIWTDPKHIVKWNNASDDWHTPHAENDLREGGKFLTRMEAKDGSVGFDFTGEYSRIEPLKTIAYTMDDGRQAELTFLSEGNTTRVIEIFGSETTNSLEMQQAGWQSILNNFKKYAEGLNKVETLHFEILINAPVEKVYKTMIDETQYSEWTSEFNAASRFEGSWNKGSRILFLGGEEDGCTGGMISQIEENIPNQFISIKHIGMILKGQEITSGAVVEGWAGAFENYTFTSKDNGTLLSVNADTVLEYKSYFLETWPKALTKLKSICEL